MSKRLVKSTAHVLLVEDHHLVRAGIRALLQGLPSVNVVAEARNGEEALKLIESYRPDVVLMDIIMPGQTGLQVTKVLASRPNSVAVIILSVHTSGEYVWQALQNGASGYLPKEASPDELEHAIRTVMSGSSYISPTVSRPLAEYIRQFGNRTSEELLTPRQREVLTMISEGNTTQEIAQTLRISVKTVEGHRAQLMERLDIHDVPGLVRYAIRTGLVKPDN